MTQVKQVQEKPGISFLKIQEEVEEEEALQG